MGKIGKKLAQYSWGILLFAILFTVAGVCLIAFPEDALPKTIIVISVFTMVFAIALVVVALAGRKRDVKFFFLLLGALCSLFAGIFLLLKRNDGAIEILSLFVGLMVIIDGSFKLHTAVMSKRYKLWLWWVMLVLSLVSIAGGLYLIKWPTVDKVKLCSVLMGLIMIVDGLQNFLTTFYTPIIDKIAKKEAVAESEAEKAEADAKEAKKAEKAESKKNRKHGKHKNADPAEEDANVLTESVEGEDDKHVLVLDDEQAPIAEEPKAEESEDDPVITESVEGDADKHVIVLDGDDEE